FGGIALRLFDVSDPASPTEIGLLLLDGFANGLAIADGFAHVIAISAGSVGPPRLQAVDVRVPELPQHALTKEGPYAALALDGTRLYGVGIDRFDVLDVAVPLAPTLLGSVSLRALQFGDVEVSGGTAYVTTGAGITVLDVSDAAHPRIVTTLTRPVAELASEFARAGNALYVATFGGRIDIYDIGTTPAAPRLLGSLALADRSAPHDLDLQGERLYVTSVRGLSILDVADATAPREIGRIESPSPAPYPGFGQAGISRDVLYLNEQPFGLGLSIFDVSDPAQPIRVGSLAPSDFDLEVVGERLFLGVSRIYDISDPSSPAPLGALPVDLAGDVVVAGSVAYGTSDFGRALIVTDFGPEYLPPLAVDIDVKPGDPHNRVLLGRPRVLPVALFGSASLDVRRVDLRSLALGPDGAPALFSVPALVNRDRKKDLLSLYWTPDTGIAFGDTEVCLTGRLESGRRLRGCDAILTHTGCGRGYETALVVPLCVPLARAARRLRRARSHSGV
ncbi:MAG TPA: hypothetical protein VFY49_17815, partial [Myxococcota bacterium]|nr:hypothetical protein [Myxococcota bacterium]